jgi:hypothetical protein
MKIICHIVTNQFPFFTDAHIIKGVTVRGDTVKERQGEDGNSSVIIGMVLKLTA